jgi:hypothetical protein
VATELGVGYISIVAKTDEFAKGINAAANNAARQASKPFDKSGKQSADKFGKSFSKSLAASLPGAGVISRATAGYSGAAGKSGALAGKAFGMAFKVAAGGAVAALGYTLFKGFQRFKDLDSAKNAINTANTSLIAMGETAMDVGDILADVQSVLLDTPFKLEQGMSQAAKAMNSGVKDIEKYLTNVSDAAAVGQTDLANRSVTCSFRR